MTGAIGVMALIAGFCWEASLTAEGIVGKVIAVAVSALAAVAAVGVAIWAALPNCVQPWRADVTDRLRDGGSRWPG